MSASDRSRTKPSTASTSRSSPDAAERTEPAPVPRDRGPRSLYVHVPFCIRRCAYCDFATAPYDSASADAYLAQLARELERVPVGGGAGAQAHPLRTIYFGGGTPTALSEPQLESLLQQVIDRAGPAAPEAAREWTCEANPESVTPSKAKLLRAAGVNRVSLGAQSFDPAVLAALGRDHGPDEVLRALEILRSAGFTRLTIDLMFAAPGESVAQLERDLERFATLGLDHVSAYCLTYEPGTPLTRMRAEGRVTPQDDDDELVQYRIVRERLAAAGLAHYEISNFARPGQESQHNLVYWRGEEYFGVGLGSGSYEWGTRRTNTRLLADYLSSWAGSLYPPHEAETLAPAARARELVVLGLRLRHGIDPSEVAARTGQELAALYPDGPIERLTDQGLLESAAGRLRLTERGLELADEVFVALV